jgi:hypothetical protein
VEQVLYAALFVEPLVSLQSLKAVFESGKLQINEFELAGTYQEALALTAAPVWFNQVVLDANITAEPVDLGLIRNMTQAPEDIFFETDDQLQLRISTWKMFCIDPMDFRDSAASLPCHLRGGQMLMSEATMRNMFAYLYTRASSTKAPNSARGDDTFTDELDRKRFRS